MTARYPAVVLALALIVGAISTQATDIAGKWTASFDTPIGQQTYTYEFVVG